MTRKAIAKQSFGVLVAAAAALALATATPAGAKTKLGSKVGTLICDTVPGSGRNLVIHSAKTIRCQFKGLNGETANYTGEAGIVLGVDLDWDRNTIMTFAVLATTYKDGAGQLAGTYGGVKAALTVGVGGGAQILVGGGNKSISLKPALEQSKGFGIAAGIGYMYLEPVK